MGGVGAPCGTNAHARTSDHKNLLTRETARSAESVALPANLTQVQGSIFAREQRTSTWPGTVVDVHHRPAPLELVTSPDDHATDPLGSWILCRNDACRTIPARLTPLGHWGTLHTCGSRDRGANAARTNDGLCTRGSRPRSPDDVLGRFFRAQCFAQSCGRSELMRWHSTDTRSTDGSRRMENSALTRPNQSAQWRH